MITFIVWLLVFPLVFYSAYVYFPIGRPDWTNIILLFIMLFLTMLLPIRFKNVSISLERWVTFTIFFQYGVFTEFIFIQLAMLILLFSEKTSLPLTHKFFVNAAIFGITSIVSGFVFYVTGGTMESLHFGHILFYGLLYASTYSLVNNILLKIYFAWHQRSYSLLSKGAIWDYISTLIMVPFSISLYFLHEYLGNKSLILVGIPFLIVLITIKMYNTSNRLHHQLAHAGKIGHELADRLLFDEVLQTFIEKLKNVIPFDHAYVVDLRSERTLIPLMGMESGAITKNVQGISFLHEKSVDDGLDMYKTKIYFNENEIKTLKNIHFKNNASSVMTTPIIRDHATEGFLVLTAERKNVFQTSDIQIIDILTGYFAISLEKARYFENTLNKSEKCGLTKLHNYRYLDRKLNEVVNDFHLNKIEKVSVIVMDIDHFKSVNDTYGHESGNELLVKLAKRLASYQNENDILARYGGEEFVFVLPNRSKEKAVAFAEKIRTEVERTKFQVIPDLSINKEPVNVNITLSLGVASIPGDARTAKKVMRNADRALYIGGKQAGRNKVGVFEKQDNTNHEETQTLPNV